MLPGIRREQHAPGRKTYPDATGEPRDPTPPQRENRTGAGAGHHNIGDRIRYRDRDAHRRPRDETDGRNSCNDTHADSACARVGASWHHEDTKATKSLQIRTFVFFVAS
jgi:hypothetical protein